MLLSDAIAGVWAESAAGAGEAIEKVCCAGSDCRDASTGPMACARRCRTASRAFAVNSAWAFASKASEARLGWYDNTVAKTDRAITVPLVIPILLILVSP